MTVGLVQEHRPQLRLHDKKMGRIEAVNKSSNRERAIKGRKDVVGALDFLHLARAGRSRGGDHDIELGVAGDKFLDEGARGNSLAHAHGMKPNARRSRS